MRSTERLPIEHALGNLADDPRLAGFAEFYAKEIEPALADFEERHTKSMIWFGILAMPALLLIIASLGYGEMAFYLAALAVIAVFYVIKVSVDLPKKQYARFVASKVASFFDTTYNDQPSPDHIAFLKSLGYLSDWDNLSIDDDITGKIEGLPVTIQEVVIHRDKSEQRLLTVVTVFPKTFKGSTLIVHRAYLTDTLARMFGPIQEVKLEDETFMSLFNVYSTDQVECRYLLTPTFMGRVNNLTQPFENYIRIAFHDNKFVIVIDSWSSWFEGTAESGRLYDPSGIVRMVRDFLHIHDLIAHLKLAARTKV